MSKEGPFRPYGGYPSLRSYKVASVVYDATVVFCQRFFAHDRRMTDQMVQAARSGVRNISEGSGAAATSSKTEMKLTNVARASLTDELLRDYESFLKQKSFRLWDKDSKEAVGMRKRLQKDTVELPPSKTGEPRLNGLFGLPVFVKEANPEIAANAMICAVHQASFLLKRQMQSQGKAFLEKGGFTEGLHKLRTGARKAEKGPACPVCNSAMVLRTAKSGANEGKQFWGCSKYPECRGLRQVGQS